MHIFLNILRKYHNRTCFIGCIASFTFNKPELHVRTELLLNDSNGNYDYWNLQPDMSLLRIYRFQKWIRNEKITLYISNNIRYQVNQLHSLKTGVLKRFAFYSFRRRLLRYHSCKDILFWLSALRREVERTTDDGQNGILKSHLNVKSCELRENIFILVKTYLLAMFVHLMQLQYWF